MRIYLPTTVTGLRALSAGGEVGPPPLAAHAVTPALREWYVEGDLDELEYAASAEAASASLRLLAADPVAVPRRVVVAADVPDGTVQAAGESPYRGAVYVSTPIPISAIASIHIDDALAEPEILAAVGALAAAEAGDEDAVFVVDGAEGHELLWYDVTELDDLTGDGSA
jgi:hypothetical protein